MEDLQTEIPGILTSMNETAVEWEEAVGVTRWGCDGNRRFKWAK